ncbi:MAG: hypothetical protein CXT67_01300 [Methanobacteriota archaeon]|jgi:tRNA(Ile2)-agmatinylcytidine synthase|nr:MAG: hypothetical protein CXT67_01300 [Euryarchaeota archaeon]HIG20010.1 DUF1743 domain-containing protein [Candidatus Poseidoniales archaeon]
MAWIGLDDTDSVDGGCTTWDFHLLLTHLEECDFTVIGHPNLVRLWPFAPERTRGNAALSAEVQTGSSPNGLIDILDDWFRNQYNSIKSSQTSVISESASPVLVFNETRFPEEWYWNAVRGYINPSDRVNEVSSISSARFWSKDGGQELSHLTRGLVGASSAIAWRGENDWTWEATAWRTADNIGSFRKVPSMLVGEMSDKFPKTILNRDPNAGDTLIAPRTPCPVLYGIRSEDSSVAEQAHNWLQSNEDVEKAFAMRVHRSNQATDDHIQNICSGMVISKVREVKGGHASLGVFDGKKHCTLVAFKQGGEVNRLLKSLVVGDLVKWRGLISPNSEIHLESLMCSDGVPRQLSRPNCQCGGKLYRQGIGQPLRCEQCGNTGVSVWLSTGFESINQWVEPLSSNRRHLAKPLSRQAKG